MNLRNCNRCGKVYVYDGFNICLDCRRAHEEDFKKVKEYLDEHPGATVVEVSEATGVETKKIIQFLKEGRLEIRDDKNIILTCERCQKPIRTGRFCDQCAVELQREINEIASKSQAYNKASERMKERIRIVDRHKKGK